MDFSHYGDQPVQMAVDLVNSYDVVSEREKLTSPTVLAEFIEAHDGVWGHSDWVPDESDLEEVRSLRTGLRQVFEASTEEDAAAVLNGLLSDVEAVPRVSLHGSTPHLHFESEGSTLARYLGAITAMGLTVALIEGGFDRFGICQAATCDDVFVDTSRNRSRLHCSETCTSRENVAAHRARKRDQV